MALEPEPDHWKKSSLQLLLQKLNKARKEGKLICGVKEVWNTATHRKGQLLVVEEDAADTLYHRKEVVDDIIEKVLKDGGDVEFVEKGALSDFQQIALIECISP